MPTVSVIMNCLNGEDYVKEAIDSVFQQTFADWELVFLDNASTDASGEIARSYGEKVVYHRNDKTVDLGQARNQALELAQGDFIAFLDADDIWMPEKLEKQLALMRAKPEVGLVFADAVIYHQYDETRTTLFKNIGQKPPRGHIFGYLLGAQLICMSTVMLRRTALREQPVYFDDQFSWAPEYDLFMRIAYQWACDYLDEPQTIYRVHKASTSERLYSQRPVELGLTLQKFYDLDPDFEKKYKQSIEANRQIIAMEQGKVCWRAGQVREARQAFARYLSSPEHFVAYCATVIPYDWVIRCWQWYSRMRRSR